MLKILMVLAGLFSLNISHANNNAKILEAFHQNGLNKCDKLILKTIDLDKVNTTWYWDTYSPKTSEVDKTVKKVNLILVSGKVGDSWKEDISITQTPENCYSRKLATITTSKTCKDSISWESWHMVKSMNGTDYGVYENRGKVPLYAKELTVGNEHVCLQEYVLTDSLRHG